MVLLKSFGRRIFLHWVLVDDQAAWPTLCQVAPSGSEYWRAEHCALGE